MDTGIANTAITVKDLTKYTLKPQIRILCDLVNSINLKTGLKGKQHMKMK